MTELDHRVQGVDHAAFPSFDPAATVRFYRDVLGSPVVHSICAAGWGPEDHPDFLHFFFDIGNDDRIAFFSSSQWPVEMQVQHETIESIDTHDPNGRMAELTRAMRPVTPREDLDAIVTIDALLDVVAGAEPTFAKLLARKAELIVERAAAWEAAQPHGSYA
ncbi:hypothetical protein GCM10027445_25880 [Amycolatopsis endophytica]|uniref:Catechol 2,3-dioxygenase-like lactoylglutathione lyase family enzyme n=1 Tax=Amycolatopsis endophytica TaxID=860233 RepID=A0A853BBC8_9PSEU|nr:VOC family protein [Amycolatopsis endophytica]NYI92320.1 catechol 2,3-dioxygenase-like lactoylglutathione lyase family enzyme [Amycolatopsis endophytica]